MQALPTLSAAEFNHRPVLEKVRLLADHSRLSPLSFPELSEYLVLSFIIRSYALGHTDLYTISEDEFDKFLVARDTIPTIPTPVAPATLVCPSDEIFVPRKPSRKALGKRRATSPPPEASSSKGLPKKARVLAPLPKGKSTRVVPSFSSRAKTPPSPPAFVDRPARAAAPLKLKSTKSSHTQWTSTAPTDFSDFTQHGVLRDNAPIGQYLTAEEVGVLLRGLAGTSVSTSFFISFFLFTFSFCFS